MIIYIHGFGSSGLGGKASQFRDYFNARDTPFIAPSLSYVPELAMTTLEELINSYDKVQLIGSSLGGYYAIYLAEKYGLKAVLINPAVRSVSTLSHAANMKGYAKNYYDESSFSWQESHIEMLKNYFVEASSKDYLLMLQTADEVLDYKSALEMVPNAKLILEEGGNHSFEKIERHFDEISQFLLS